ncbi:thioredoxin family protein [Desulfitobacterium sp.]|uniref:thioredoxin family protein n=1 Tax=Desulfitobacterium sp. TaxID=49981 RepID=UPI002C541DF1|nr:thioredoxin family protein [Desulfitobacterium sp.]HVJ49058.1 thioredoxin family protein [Desulfitobacterium sp.]
MKPVLMFTMKSCPYCKQALQWMDELSKENDQYSRVAVTIIDEDLQPDIAKQYDYYYVPTYFVDGVKLHEGVPTKDIVRNVFERSLENN